VDPGADHVPVPTAIGPLPGVLIRAPPQSPVSTNAARREAFRCLFACTPMTVALIVGMIGPLGVNATPARHGFYPTLSSGISLSRSRCAL
jgi:hypothetical protein